MSQSNLTECPCGAGIPTPQTDEVTDSCMIECSGCGRVVGGLSLAEMGDMWNAALGAFSVGELKKAASKVVERVLSVYNAEYIKKCVEQEPDSLLALVKHLESVIAKTQGS